MHECKPKGANGSMQALPGWQRPAWILFPPPLAGEGQGGGVRSTARVVTTPPTNPGPAPADPV